MAPEWFDEYFDSLYLQVSGLGLESAARQVDFVIRALELPSGASVLDVGCGHGRHSVELARRGYRVAGLDRSRPLLEKARELCREAGVTVELVEEDMRAIPETWAARFDAALNVFTSWGYFEADGENEKAMQAVARSLRLGGRLFLDYVNHERTVREFRPRSWRETSDGLVILDATTLDLLGGRVETARTVLLPDGRRVDRWISVRLFTLAEVRNLLDRCGLKVIATYGDFDGSPYGMDSPRMIAVAERAR